jgi:hypothetical protein
MLFTDKNGTPHNIGLTRSEESKGMPTALPEGYVLIDIIDVGTISFMLGYNPITMQLFWQTYAEPETLITKWCCLNTMENHPGLDYKTCVTIIGKWLVNEDHIKLWVEQGHLLCNPNGLVNVVSLIALTKRLNAHLIGTEFGGG